MIPGDIVKLIGKTRYGKNKVHEQGSEHRVIKMLKTKIKGEEAFWVCLESIKNNNHGRWVKISNDLDFEIVE